MSIEVSIILPSLNRVEKLLRTITNLYDTTGTTSTELIIVLSTGDQQSQEAMRKIDHPFITCDPISAVYSWNEGAKVAKGNWLMIASDDVIYPVNWLKAALDTPNHGFVAIGDGYIHKDFEPFYMATRDWLKKYQNGVLAVPHYRHWGIDPEICFRAKWANQFVLSPVPLKHEHPTLGFKEDATYKRSKKWHERDIALLNQRIVLGFPNDFIGYL